MGDRPPFNPTEIYLGGLLTYPPELVILLFRGLGEMLKVGQADYGDWADIGIKDSHWHQWNFC